MTMASKVNILTPSFDWTNVDFESKKNYNRDQEGEDCQHPNSPPFEGDKLYRTKFDLKSASNYSDYTDLSECGEGAYGRVYSALYKQERVAIKFITESQRDGESCKEAARREREMLHAAKDLHNVVHLLGWGFCPPANEIFLVTKLHTPLLNTPSTRFDLQRIQKIARGLFKGLDGLHRRGIFHGDIKPENILVNAEGEGVLADLGHSAYCDEPKFYPLHSLEYRDPQVMILADYDHTVDLWPMGCTLFELGAGRVLFDSIDHQYGWDPPLTPELHTLHLIVQLLGLPSKQFILAGDLSTCYFDTTTFKLLPLPNRSEFKKKGPNLDSLKDACLTSGQSPELTGHLISLIGGLVTYGEKISAAKALQSPFLAGSDEQ